MNPVFLTLVVTLFLDVTVISWAQDQKESTKTAPDLFIESYVIPPTFVGTAIPNSRDVPLSLKKGKRKTAKEILEAAGISFPKGAFAKYDVKTSKLTVVNTEDQLELVDAFVGTMVDPGEPKIHIILEYIETDSARFHDWMFENRITTDGTPLRKEAQKWVKEDKATIIETVIVNARSGQRAKTESVHEVIYPTDWNPGKIPNEVSLSGKDAVSPMTVPIGTAYEMRKVGSRLEVDPVLGGDYITIDMIVAPEIVQQKRLIHWSPNPNDLRDSFPMPGFHKLKITTQVTTLHRRYSFLGAVPPLKAADPKRKKPIVLVFVRGDIVIPPEPPQKRYRRYRQ